MLEEFYDCKEARSLAGAARTIAGRKEVLPNGTRSSRSILSSDTLTFLMTGYPAVSFSRSPEAVAYWAVLPRFEVDEGAGAILVLDRRVLRAAYRIELHPTLKRVPRALSTKWRNSSTAGT
jgi:hypothetical protein